jgi:RNA polymerase sigma-70 factor (ECF subfamily)
MTESDEHLMQAVRDGDVARLGSLFDRHHRALFEFFVRMTGSGAVADDLVQDVFFRMLKYRGTFRNESRFKGWMFHIARNARVDHYKKHRAVTLLAEDGAENVESRSLSPGRELEQGEQAALLERALQKLDADKREVLVLSRYQDMKYEQIAEIMECEVGTIKTRVHRALKELRQIFLKLSGERELCVVKKSGTNLQIM